MSTARETTTQILELLGNNPNIRVRAMFGEYALYANDRVVALICDDQLYVKICPATAMLEKRCDKDTPYPGARPHYLVTESQLESEKDLTQTLFAIAESLPAKKK